MLTFIILILVGRSFFNLAKKNNKNPVRFIILGIVSYYFTTFIVDFVVAFALADFYTDWIGYVSIPFGLLAAWITYSILKSTLEPKQARREKNRNRVDNNVRSSYSTLNPSKAVESKVHPQKTNESMSSQSTHRYNKNER